MGYPIFNEEDRRMKNKEAFTKAVNKYLGKGEDDE